MPCATATCYNPPPPSMREHIQWCQAEHAHESGYWQRCRPQKEQGKTYQPGEAKHQQRPASTQKDELWIECIAHGLQALLWTGQLATLHAGYLERQGHQSGRGGCHEPSLRSRGWGGRCWGEISVKVPIGTIIFILDLGGILARARGEPCAQPRS